MRQDHHLREADYLWALRGWIETEGYDTLIFCENSGASLTNIEKYAHGLNKFNRELVFLSCDKNAKALDRGKGHGEMEIIRHALDNFTGLGLASTQLLVKVSGRSRARQGERLLRRLSDTHADLFCSIGKNLTWADSRLFGITVNCAKEQLLPRQETINDRQGRNFEHALAEAVHATVLSGGIWSLLPCDPLLHGYAGTTGARFGFSPLGRLKSELRDHIIRRLY
jgi:hypothetical protein